LENNVSKKNLFYFAYVVGILCLFIISFMLIANEIEKNKLIQFDQSVISIIQLHISPLLTEIMKFFTFLGSTKWITFAVLVGIAVLFLLKKWSLGVFLAFSSGFGSVFNSLLKNIFKRQRPDIHRLISEHGYSFPSGHSMGSFIFYGALAYIILHYAHKKGWKVFGIIMMTLLILLIGTSRIYLGVHYPSDVIGGFAAGASWLFITILLFRFYEYRNNL
jgi:membrane-associated phospholipid phosphatase